MKYDYIYQSCASFEHRADYLAGLYNYRYFRHL